MGTKLKFQTNGDKRYSPGSFDKTPAPVNRLNTVVWRYPTKKASSQKTQGPESQEMYLAGIPPC